MEKNLKKMLIFYLVCLKICSICNLSNGYGCSYCGEGQFLDWQGFCLPCFESCKVCRGPLLEDCALPKDGFYFKKAEKIIEKCPQIGCGKCNPNKCISCGKGYRAVFKNNKMHRCVPCPEHCVYCDQVGCMSCEQGFLPKDNLCIKSQSDCAIERDVLRPDYMYYSIHAARCFKCDRNCEECVSEYKCMHCYPGYRLNHKNFRCEKCEVENCLHCPDDKFNCSDCKNGFYYDKDTRNCQRCAKNCSSCFGPDSDHCKACYFPYQLEKYLDKSFIDKLHEKKADLRAKYSRLSGLEIRSLNLNHLGQKNRCVFRCKESDKNGNCVEVVLETFDLLTPMEDL